MNAFLKHVAEDLYKKYGNRLADTAIVFPNKRAGLFFNEYLKQMSAEPLWSPAYMTINELFAECSDLVEGDNILLVSKLYKVFCKHTGSSEPLDRFYYWGEMLIKDFDDIDKNLVDAEKLFVNLKELREMGNAADILDDEQKRPYSNSLQTSTATRRTKLSAASSTCGECCCPYTTIFASLCVARESPTAE